MNNERTTFLKRISDAYLPFWLVDLLSNTVFCTIGTTDVNGWTIKFFTKILSK